tara:strand:+ start:250 stop:558 length:309 start_codon:yes stop_codon:yes gene_type:complete
MKKPMKDKKGVYKIKGKNYKMLVGSRAQVWHKTAYKTSGGLTKKNLKMNKYGRIVSAKKHKTAKNEKRLEKHGFYSKKGCFGYVKSNKFKKSKKSKTVKNRR